MSKEYRISLYLCRKKSMALDLICKIVSLFNGLLSICRQIINWVSGKKKPLEGQQGEVAQAEMLKTQYKLDLRAERWTGRNSLDVVPEFVIKNYGTNIVIDGIEDIPKNSILDARRMENWFPYHYDTDSELHIPLCRDICSVSDECDIIIICKNRLEEEYRYTATFLDGRFAGETVS